MPPNSSGLSTWKNQRSLLFAFGFAGAARQLEPLSWVRTAVQSRLETIPLVVDSRTQVLAGGEGLPLVFVLRLYSYRGVSHFLEICVLLLKHGKPLS